VPDADIHGFRKARDAQAFIETNHCDIAFLDINLRGASGITFANELRAINPKLNIIFTTGYSEYTVDAFRLHASGYVLKPVTQAKIQHELDELRFPLSDSARKRVRIRAFGNFEIYADGKPIKFQYTKTKELIAYLVDRIGTTATINEMLSVLWEDESKKSHISYLKNIRSDLLSTLAELDCDDIILRVRGGLAIVPDKVDCDYFNYLKGSAKDDIVSTYRGEYMSQYTWASNTEAQLAQLKKQKI
jgi:two-component SAPR family response regulator